MERHKCKLCSRSFSNGKALGGHMRYHMTNLPIPPKPQRLGDRTESASFSSSSGDEKALVYGLRENPKKSFRMVDPEFLDAGSVVQDRESETESSRNPTRKRSERTRKLGNTENHKLRKPSTVESVAEPEPVSSVSDTSPEEDVAMSLMLLSRDIWMGDNKSVEESDELKQSRTRGKYQCETCKKVFRSYQALGGHRTSHKKIKSCFQDQEDESKPRNAGNVVVVDRKVHECPFCYKVFGSGQALGGHKRSHLLSSRTTTNYAKFGHNSIDLNMPAPIEDDDFSQVELSAVSDAELISPIKL